MTAHAALPSAGAQGRLADAVGALRLLVVAALVLDAASTFWYLRSPAAGEQATAVTAAQLALTAAAAAAVVWIRPRLAVLLCGVVVLLAVVAGPTSEELWLLVVVAVTVTSRGQPRTVLAVALAELAFVLFFALEVQRSSGWGGWALLIAAGGCLVGHGAGLLVRRSLRAAAGRQQRLAELEQQNEQVRSAERLRLADDLQTVVTGGLAAIGRQLDELRGRSGDPGALRRGLGTIERESRAVLAELRALLEVLRREPGAADEQPRGVADRPDRRPPLVTRRQVRLAAAGTFLLLAGRTALGGSTAPLAPTTVVPVLGWLACAVAVHRPRAGAATAAVALAVSLATGMPTSWSALPTVVLFFLASRRAGVRLLWVVVGVLLVYGALVVALVPGWAVPLTTTAYAAAPAVVAGLAARHFLDDARDSASQQASLLEERAGLAARERAAVARELHDVVAHQLSLTTLAIMGTSASADPVALAGTVQRVAESVEAADRELAHLLHTMRGARSDQVSASPLVLPSAGAETFARRLSAHGFAPVVEADPSADELDVTTMRTLGRVMQEATTNILRYAPPGSRCRYTLGVVDDEVRLSVVSPLAVAAPGSPLSLGWGLRGVAERVALSHGAFHAGPREGTWTVEVTLPRAREYVAAAVLAR